MDTDLTLPSPIVGPDVSLQDMEWFPFHHDLLMASELWALSSGDEFKAAMSLWCRAWKQKPAATLPNDDRILAAFAGVPIKRWPKIKDMAMRGFVLCSDGRYHHKVLGNEAVNAWKRKESYSARGVAGNVQRSLKANKHEADGIVDGSLKDASGIEQPSLEIAKTRQDKTGQKKESPDGESSSVPADLPALSFADLTMDEQIAFQDLPESDRPAYLARVHSDRNPTPQKLAAQKRLLAQAGLDAFNAVAARHGLSLASRLNDDRLKSITARITEAGGIDEFRAAMAMIPKSAFLLGSTGWKCTLDNLIRPTNFLKLSEGGYSDSAPKGNFGQGGSDTGGYAQGFR